jgi:hypothetical protein
MTVLIRRYQKEVEDFHREFTQPFEAWLTSGRRWPGGYRWFRAENVTPIEYYKRVRTAAPDPGVRKAG